MNWRHTTVAAIVAVAVGLTACGGGDAESSNDRSATSESTSVPTPKAALGEAIEFYNRGYASFITKFRSDASAGDFPSVKEDIAAFRTVVFDLDKRIRAIEFDPSMTADLNGILTKNRALIARLDAVGKAESFGAAIPLYDRVLKARTASVTAINRLLDEL